MNLRQALLVIALTLPAGACAVVALLFLGTAVLLKFASDLFMWPARYVQTIGRPQ